MLLDIDLLVQEYDWYNSGVQRVLSKSNTTSDGSILLAVLRLRRLEDDVTFDWTMRRFDGMVKADTINSMLTRSRDNLTMLGDGTIVSL